MYWLLNSAVIPVGGDGDYRYHTVSRAEAVEWLCSREFVSRIGYPDNQAFLQRIAGIRVELSREESAMQPGDEALVVRPVYRLRDGAQKKSFRPHDNDFGFGILRRLT